MGLESVVVPSSGPIEKGTMLEHIVGFNVTMLSLLKTMMEKGLK
jgi:hypothetical protein